MSKKPENEESFKEAQHEEDAMDEVMTAGGVPIVPMEEMKDQLEMMIPSKADWSEIAEEEEQGKGEVEGMTEKEMDDLLEEKTPVIGSSEEVKTMGDDQILPSSDNKDDHEDDADFYAESFASQKETSQLREELEQMSEEVRSLKVSLSGLLGEREALPGHLTSIREDINSQMTLMLSKLHSALESDAVSSNIQAAAATLEEVKERSVDRLGAAASYATDRPRENSPLATKGSELKGKHRFRPVK